MRCLVGKRPQAAPMEPFIGSEAVAAGEVRKHQLRANFRAVYPNVYVSADTVLTVRQRATAGWLWSGRRGVVGGLTAAALYGARWVDPDEPIELIHACGRPPDGIRIHAAVLQPGETVTRAGLPVTTPHRTAFDLGRRGRLEDAVARLDALARATNFDVDGVGELARRHPHSRGLRQLERALPLVDAGAQSPPETRLRLLLTDAGLPRPRTQIPINGPDGRLFAYLDMGWEDWMVAVEYDGDQHRVDRRQYVKDIRRLEALEQLGWSVIRVVAEDRRADILRRVRAAVSSRQLTLH
jgi:hypothetical protein